MTDAEPLALTLVLCAAVGLAAILAQRLTARLRVPAPALFLVAAALAVHELTALHAPSPLEVERIVTVALVLVLFDGGLRIGAGRLSAAAGAIATIGLPGTFLTAAGASLVARYGLHLSWYEAVLLGTAVSPTDPAVVFSVLGRREVAGRAGTILEGESGANDPVGIALMTSLLAAGGLSTSAFGHVALTFVLQMVIGAAIGLVGGRALLWFMRTVPLPGEGLYALRSLASALILFGAATLAHGSGFLAVFVAGIVLGDEPAPFKREIERFHGALSALAEIVAFIVLGLSVNLAELAHRDVWLPGLVLGVLLALLIRPVFAWCCLARARLRVNERSFIALAGLKGAVPILLASTLLADRVHGAPRLYGIVVVVVIFSVVVQGGLIPTLAALLRLPMRVVEPEPFAFGVRLRDEPKGTYRMTIERGARADGKTVSELDALPDGAWIALLLRDGDLVQVLPSTRLHAGDDVTVLAEPGKTATLSELFETVHFSP